MTNALLSPLPVLSLALSCVLSACGPAEPEVLSQYPLRGQDPRYYAELMVMSRGHTATKSVTWRPEGRRRAEMSLHAGEFEEGTVLLTVTDATQKRLLETTFVPGDRPTGLKLASESHDGTWVWEFEFTRATADVLLTVTSEPEP